MSSSWDILQAGSRDRPHQKQLVRALLLVVDAALGHRGRPGISIPAESWLGLRAPRPRRRPARGRAAQPLVFF